eukprot:5273030-Pyramimonas_sp.AAC.2
MPANGVRCRHARPQSNCSRARGAICRVRSDVPRGHFVRMPAQRFALVSAARAPAPRRSRSARPRRTSTVHRASWLVALPARGAPARHPLARSGARC